MITQSTDRYLRSPRLVASGDGARLSVIAWERQGERVLTFALSASLEVGEPTATDFAPAVPALTPGAEPAPTDDASVEDRDEANGFRVDVRRTGYRSRVVLTTPAGDEVLVWDAWGTAAAPAVAAATGGAWVAFHHNVREDDGRAGPRQVDRASLRRRGGAGLRAAAEMRDRDRDREGEEQSFEFPTLAVGDDGAMALFGRGSHTVLSAGR